MTSALDLFEKQGFERTTVEQIAAAAEISPRTFFRYFGSKEAVVLGKVDAMNDALVARLRGRPSGEDAWRAIRRTFDYFTEQLHDADSRRRGTIFAEIVENSEDLQAARAERMRAVQSDLAAELTHREHGANPTALEHARSVAIVGAAFACLNACSLLVESGEMELDTALDRVMRVFTFPEV